jgi:large subunit ribosomal protein L9
MKLLLTKNVARLGLVGEVVDVADGYGRNFLLPRGLATEPTKANVKRLEAERIKMKELEEQRVGSLKALAERLKDAEITVVERSNDEGVLYGSVSARRIADELAKEGFPVPEEAIRLGEPLRRVDIYEVPIELHHEVKAQIKVYVSPEKQPEGQPAPAQA